MSHKKFLPWEETQIWDNESQYLAWFRGKLREVWMDWPLKIEFKNDTCILVTQKIREDLSFKGNVKFVAECSFCKKYFPKSQLEVDHIIPVGSLTKVEMIPDFIGRLLCSKDNMRLACSRCHKIHSYAERYGMSFEDARLEKAVIAWLAENDTAAQKAILTLAGFPDEEINNAGNRRKAARKLLADPIRSP